jgi:predicted RNA methylase
MNDYERNNAYSKAIKRAIKNNENVLEIGTGSGLLSMMAVDAGAKKVITCEVSETISETARKIIANNGYSDRIKVINKKSTHIDINSELGEKADIIISEILSSEFVGEGVQQSLSDANRRLLKENGIMIPEAGEIKIALLESSPEIEKELFVQKVNGYDLSEFNNIMRSKCNVQYLGRKTKTSFLSKAKTPFSFNFYNKNIINRQEKILEIEAFKSGICLGLISWLSLDLYENICFENNPTEICTSGWVNPIYKFNQPLKMLKGDVIKVKATLLKDTVWYEFI